IKVLQINVNHCDLLTQDCYEENIDVALISEQYRNYLTSNWISDTTGKATVGACGSKPIDDTPLSAEQYFVRAKVGGIHFFSCFLPPSLILENFERAVDNITIHARGKNPAIIGGDFNAWASEWDLMILHISFATNSLSRIILWHVSNTYTHSDHKAIIMCTGNTTPRTIIHRGWKEETLDEDLFRFLLPEQETLREDNADTKAAKLSKLVCSSCDAAMVLKQHGRNRRGPAIWWSQVIEEARRGCIKVRRKLTRNKDETRREAFQLCFKIARRALKR
ncbi:hypothetical protein KR222_006687, partial [Zaprionus bogoriensis]